MFENAVIREIGYLVIFCIVLIAVAWYLPKLNPKFSGRSQSKDHEQGEVPSVKDSTPVIPPNYDQRYADWMSTAIQDDVSDLPGCITVNELPICWEHLEEREDAYIEFNFDIWSSSVHLLEISKQVEENIYLRGCGEVEYIPLKDKPEITQKTRQLSHLRRSRSTKLTIKQWLSFTVKGRMQTHYRRSQVEFDFSKVNISVVATLPDGSQGTTCRLPIPSIVYSQVPDHPNPNAPVPYKEGSQK